MALQADVGSDYAGPVRDALLPMLQRFRGVAAPPGPAFALLEAWDGAFPADSAAAALYFFTLRAKDRSLAWGSAEACLDEAAAAVDAPKTWL